MADTPQAEALLPCPFCGSKAEIEHGSDHHGDWFNLGCSNHWGKHTDGEMGCKAGRLFYIETETPEADAIKAWNTRAAQPEVAPDDEALNVHRFSFDGRAIEVDGEYEFVKASEVRRRIAELQYAVAVWRSKAETRGREGAEARAALAACRAATIEDVAMLFNVMDPDEMLFTGDVAARIRALKTKEPTNG